MKFLYRTGVPLRALLCFGAGLMFSVASFGDEGATGDAYLSYQRYLNSRMNSGTLLERLWRPRRSYPYRERAFRLLGEGDREGALKELERYLEVDPEHHVIRWYHLVTMASAKPAPKRVIAAADEFLRHLPSFGPALLIRADAYQRSGADMKAERDYEAALEDQILAPADRLRAKRSIYYLAYRNGQYAKALSLLEELVGAEPQLAGLLWQKVEMLEKLGRREGALDTLKRIATPGDEFHRLAKLAVLSFQTGRLEEALNYYSRALALEDRRELRIQAAEVAWQLGRYGDVVIFLRPVVTSSQEGSEEIDLPLLQRLCDAYSRQKEYEKALECLIGGIESGANKKELLKQALWLANKADVETLSYQQRLYAVAPDARLALSIARKLEQSAKSPLAGQWFRRAWRLRRNFETGYAYAMYLAGNRRDEEAITVLQYLAYSAGLSGEHRYQSLVVLGNLLNTAGDNRGAFEVWGEALELKYSPVLQLQRAQVMYKTGDMEKAASILEHINPRQLSDRSLQQRRDLMAAIRYKQHRYADSVRELKELLRTNPTAARWMLLADVYMAMGRVEEADDALSQANALEGGGASRHLLQRAYLNIRAKRDYVAEPLLLEALEAQPGKRATISEELGYLYLRTYRNRQAVEYLTAARNGYREMYLAGRLDGAEAAEKERALRQLIRTVSRRFTLSLYQSINLFEERAGDAKSAFIGSSRHATGELEIGYRPEGLGYRNGSIFNLFLRTFWASRDRGAAILGESLQAGVGIRYKPLAEKNLWLSAERLFKVGGNTADHWMLRTAWSYTQGLEPYASRGKAYLNLYLDVAKLFENTGGTLLFAEGRYGRSYLFGGRWIATPFMYLRGNGEINREDHHLVDAGLGLELRGNGQQAVLAKPYRRLNWGLFLRAGSDLSSDRAKQGFQLNIGFRLSH